MTIRLHRGDLPDLTAIRPAQSRSTPRPWGLTRAANRLCVVQLSPGDGSADVVQMPAGRPSAPNLAKLLADPNTLKIFHFGRFDLGVLYQTLGVMAAPVYCTKIASRLARTYTDKHGLKDLVKELLGVDLSKQQQLSDWGSAELSDAQVAYAASDVLHLHALKAKLDGMLARESRTALTEACFRFSARSGAARPRGLGRRGYFLAFLNVFAALHGERGRMAVPGSRKGIQGDMPRRSHICWRWCHWIC